MSRSLMRLSLVAACLLYPVGPIFAQPSGPILIRNNDIQSVDPITPPLASLFDPATGQLLGEEILQDYQYAFHSEDIAQQDDGPLVLYQLDDSEQTLFLAKTPNARVVVNSFSGDCRFVGAAALDVLINNVPTLYVESTRASALFGVADYHQGVVCEDADGTLSIKTNSSLASDGREVALLYFRDVADVPASFILVMSVNVLDLFNVDGGFRHDRFDPDSPIYATLDASGNLAGGPAENAQRIGVPTCEEIGIAYRDCLVANQEWLDVTQAFASVAFGLGNLTCISGSDFYASCGITFLGFGALLIGPLTVADCEAQIPPAYTCSLPPGASQECVFDMLCNLDSGNGNPYCSFGTSAPGTCTSSRDCGGPGYCTNGLCWTDPNPPEICDDYDNDCDLIVDSFPTTCGIGACASSGVCEGGVDNCAPGDSARDDSACNGIDDDCDALTDEDYVPAGTSCGVGVCASTGTTSCVNGVVADDCVPGTPTPEICDGIDNNCDGEIDEGIGECDTPLTTVPVWTAVGAQPGGRFGEPVTSAGDVNGDGYDDVIVGAAAHDNGQADEGMVFVYHGSASGLSTTPDWTAESDQAGAHLGFRIATAGDVNGDGYDDVLVGASSFDNGETDEGAVFAYYGSASGLNLGVNGTPQNADWMAEGNQANILFGYAVDTAGDVNGDGYSDIIIGAWQYLGRAWVYHGSASGLSTNANWSVDTTAFAQFCFSRCVATAGDVNDDGYSDVIVGTYLSSGFAALVYHGSATGLSTTPDWIAESNNGSAQFGTSVATAGDVNGDGYDDVLIGAYRYTNGESDEGGAFVYHGSASGLPPAANWTTADWSAEADQADAAFGYSARTAGDINGDGYSDVIVGAFFFDNGETDEGRAFVYLGSATGLSTIADWTAESNQPEAFFGHDVDTAGDVNGDGVDDVIVGARGSDNNTGRAYVYHGVPE